jgi:hypothetical protein
MSLISTCLTPKPLAPSVYVHAPEAPSPREQSISVTSLFPSIVVVNVASGMRTLSPSRSPRFEEVSRNRIRYERSLLMDRLTPVSQLRSENIALIVLQYEGPKWVHPIG